MSGFSSSQQLGIGELYQHKFEHGSYHNNNLKGSEPEWANPI